MSRRTPIKELIAEDAGTPSSPMRRSSRIATRRSSALDEGGVDESDRVSISSTSSIGSKSGRKVRPSSKSPLPLNDENVTRVSLRRTRKGSTSSLIDEELSTVNRGGSPTPGRVTRRSLARSLSVSPISELESKTRKTSTPQKPIFEGATSKGGLIKRTRRLSVTDTALSLESIKEMEPSPKKQNNKNSIETTDEKDLPVKKKKSALLQTITEKSFTEDLETNKTENNICVNSDQSVKSDQDTEKSRMKTRLSSSKETEITPKEIEKSSKETKTPSKETEQFSNKTKCSPNKDDTSFKETEKSSNEIKSTPNKDDLNIENSKKTIPTLSLKRRLNSNSSIEEKELVVVLTSLNESHDSLNKSADLNCSLSKENSSLKEHTDKLNSEDENLSLHISGSEDGDEKDKKSLLNQSHSSNKSMNTNVEEKIAPHHTELDTNNLSVEVNDKNLHEANHSFCEPMDVDVTVLESSCRSKSDHNDKEITSTDLNTSKDLNHSDSGKLDDTEVNNEADNVLKNPFNTSTGPILNTSSKLDRSNTSAEKKDSPQKNKQFKDNEDSSKNISTPQKINSTHSDEIHLKLSEIETTEASFSCSKISVLKDDQREEVSLQISSSSNGNTSIAILVSEELDPMQCQSPDKSNVSTNVKNEIIVATNLTPVRRSPRLQHSPNRQTKTLFDKSVSDDVLKINTPPDSIKSENSSKDELELSGDEPKGVTENTCDISKNIDEETEREKDKKIVDDLNESKTENNLNASQKSNLENKSQNNISFSSEPELNATLQKKIIELTETLEIVDSNDESVTKFIDDMAEEGEEDTPSEGSNDIIDLGESIGSTESEIDSDESYELDSFIDDDEDVQLLSGEEYDLDQEKSKPKPSRKRRKIIQINSSSEDEGKGTKVEGEKNKVSQQNGMKNKPEDDSDVEKMSTQPYCGLTPPSIVSVRDSPSEEETKTFNNKDDEESVTSVVINTEDNLESLEQIKDHNKDPDNKDSNSSLKGKSPAKITPLKASLDKTPTVEEKPDSVTPNNSILETSTSRADSAQQRKRLSSLTIQETVNIKDISNGSVSDRILKVVEVFCSTVTKSKDGNSGNISLNVSLDYVGTSPENPSFHEEHKEVIEVESSRQNLLQSFNTESNSDKSASSKGTTRKKSLEIKKSSPIKTLFANASTSDEQNVSGKENYQLITKPTRKSKKRKAAQEAVVASDIKKGKKKKAKNAEVDSNIIKGDIKEKPKFLESTTKFEVTVESDSDMSPDLDKELNKKYNSLEIEDKDSSSAAECPKINVGKSKKNKKQRSKKTIDAYESADEDDLDGPNTSKKLVNKKKYNEISSVNTAQARREKRIKLQEEDSNQTGWKVQYLPKEIKVALSQGRPTKKSESSVTQKKTIESKINKKPKLVPSLVSRKRSWISDEMDLFLKPSTSSDINKIKKLESVNVESFNKKDFKNRTLFDSKRVKRMDTTELLKKKGKTKF